MAWPKDNARLLPPVKSKLQAGIDKGVVGNVAQAIGAGATMPPRAMAVLAQKAPVTQAFNVVGAGVNRLTTDAQGRTAAATANTQRLVGDGRGGVNPQMPNFNAAATQLPARQRPVRGEMQPDGSRLIESLPAYKPPPRPTVRQDQAIPGMGPLTATPNQPQQPGRQQPAGPTRTVYEQDQRGMVVPIQQPVQQKQTAAPQPQQQNRLTGTQRVGNMDVAFAPDTPMASRQAFMADPVKPEGQIAQYNRNAMAEADRQEYNRSKEQGQGQDLFTPENSPNMGWKERTALNEQKLRNQGGMDEARLSSDTTYGTTRLNNENQLENTRLTGKNSLANTNMQGNQNLALEAVQGRNTMANTRLTGEIDSEQAREQRAAEAQAANRLLHGEMLKEGKITGGEANRLNIAQGDSAPDYNGIRIEPETADRGNQYDYVAPEYDTAGKEVIKPGGAFDKRAGRLIPFGQEPAVDQQQPATLQLPPERMRVYDQHRQSLEAVKDSPEAVRNRLEAIFLSDPDLYDALLLQLSNDGW